MILKKNSIRTKKSQVIDCAYTFKRAHCARLRVCVCPRVLYAHPDMLHTLYAVMERVLNEECYTTQILSFDQVGPTHTHTHTASAQNLSEHADANTDL